MKVLVVGGGGREHAIVEALHRSQADIYAAMSNQNPGIRRRSKDVLLGDVTDVERIVSWGKGHGIELAVIGPEAPLGKGITDALEAAAILTGGKGVRVWGDHFSTKAEALAYGREILEKKIGGTARFLIEEKLVGEEFSLQAFCDGRAL